MNGKVYRIEWWKNISYLHRDGLVVVFERVNQSPTWPNRAKLNLQFYYGANTTAIIELEHWT